MEVGSTEGTDEEFEVTAEMMIHGTMDDETTLAAEEALQTKEEDAEELSGLQQEGNMPLEQLLSLYGYSAQLSDRPSLSKAHVGSNSTSNLPQFESSSRPRRKRARGVEVVLLGNASEPSATTLSSSSPPLPPCPSNVTLLPDLSSSSSLATSVKQFEDTCSKAFAAFGGGGGGCGVGGDGKSEFDSQQTVHPVESNRISSRDVSVPLGGIVDSSNEAWKPSGEEVDQAPWKPSGEEGDQSPWKPSGEEVDQAPWKPVGEGDQSPWKPSGEGDQSPWKPSGEEGDQSPWKPSGEEVDQVPWKPSGEGDQSPWKPSGEEVDQVSWKPSGEGDQAPWKPSGEEVDQDSVPSEHQEKVLGVLEENEFPGQKMRQEAWAWSEVEQGDTTDVEVVEDDGVGLEVNLSGRDEGLFQLAEIEREGSNVVRMDDIEAGLSKGERFFSPLDLMKKEEFIGDYSMQTDVEGLGMEDMGKAENVVEEEKEIQEEGGGMEDGAIYEDVMLSSSSNSRLLSDSPEEFQPVPSGPTASSVPSSDAGKSFIRGSRLRSEIPERRSMRLMNNDDRALLTAYFASVLSDGSGSDSDEEYSPQVDWKKEVKVGMEYQATIPDYSPITPYPSTSKSLNKLVWTPRGTTEEEVSTYLGSISEVAEKVSKNPCRHELALEVLSHSNHNLQRALIDMQATSSQQGTSPWTEEETKAFEDGLRSVGKDFFLLHRKVPSRTVKELVEFYYLWKKSERYDHFIQTNGKIGRKKIIVSPGHVSDFMDKYLDMHNSDAIDVHYLTTTVAAEVKKENC